MNKKIERTRGSFIKREASFYGNRSVGLDSGFIASLIYHEEAFQKYQQILNESLFNYTHEECVGGNEIKIENSEVFKVLTTKYGFGENEARNKIKNFLEKYKIKTISKTRINSNLVTYLYREGRIKNIEVHPPDVWIIADFKAFGVNLVYSNNKHFRELCSLLNISAPYFPTEEKQTVDKPLRELYWKSTRDRFKEKFKRGYRKKR